jgi:hypothetical protein
MPGFRVPVSDHRLPITGFCRPQISVHSVGSRIALLTGFNLAAVSRPLVFVSSCLTSVSGGGHLKTENRNRKDDEPLRKKTDIDPE